MRRPESFGSSTRHVPSGQGFVVMATDWVVRTAQVVRGRYTIPATSTISSYVAHSPTAPMAASMRFSHQRLA